MRNIRVLVGDVPAGVWHWIGSADRSEIGIQVVGHAEDTVQILLKVGQTDADVVVATLARGGEEPGLVSHLLGEYPYVVVLALAPELDYAVIFRLATVREDVVGAEPNQVWSLLRRIVDGR